MTFSLSLALYRDFIHVFLSLKHQNTHIKHPKKHIKASRFFSLHQKHKVLFLYPIFLFFVLHFEFRVQGCGCSFSKSFSRIYLSIFARITCFITFSSIFLVLFVFLAQISWLLCLVLCLMLRSTSLHAYMFRSTYLRFYAMLRSIFIALLLLYLSFLCLWPIGSDSIQTLWSLSSSIHLGPYQRAWIIPILHVYACLLLCFRLVLVFPVLGSATPLAGLWLCGHIRHP